MKRLKHIAYELIDLKKELNNDDYAPVIKRALELSVDQMLEKGFIDLDTQLYVKDKMCSMEDFITHLEQTDIYKKTTEELELEYKKFIELLNNEIIELGLDPEEFYCKADISEEKIKICKVFSLKEEFLKAFFYFNPDYDDVQLEKLMKRKGFIEKFAILRLPRIFFNFIDLCKKNDSFVLEKTYPYYSFRKNCYSIDLVFNIDISKIELDENRVEVLKEIIPIIHEANIYFEERMSI